MKAFFVSQVSLGKYRLSFGSQTVEGNLAKIVQVLAESVTEECRDIKQGEALRFELTDIIPSASLANAVHELEGVTRAKQTFYDVCREFRARPGADTLAARYEAYDLLISALTGMNLDNLWHAIGVSGPDKAA